MRNPLEFVLLAAFAATISVGCGSNPSNCLSDAVIQAWVDAKGLPDVRRLRHRRRR